MPRERGGNYFFMKRLAGEQQYSIYVRKGWTANTGASGAINSKDVRLIDPGKLSRDANTSVGIADVSRDGNLLAYTQQTGGADEAGIHILDVKTGKTLEDELPTARYFGVSFAPNGASFYYARGDKQGTLLFQHTMGTRPSRPVCRRGDRRRQVPGGPDQAGRAGPAGGYCLPRSDQAGRAV
jgi:prolyl oligopeptidase